MILTKKAWGKGGPGPQGLLDLLVYLWPQSAKGRTDRLVSLPLGIVVFARSHTQRCGCPVGSTGKSVGCCWILVWNILIFPEIFISPPKCQKIPNYTTWGHQTAKIFGKISEKIPSYKRDKAEEGKARKPPAVTVPTGKKRRTDRLVSLPVGIGVINIAVKQTLRLYSTQRRMDGGINQVLLTLSVPCLSPFIGNCCILLDADRCWELLRCKVGNSLCHGGSMLGSGLQKERNDVVVNWWTFSSEVNQLTNVTKDSDWSVAVNWSKWAQKGFLSFVTKTSAFWRS